MRYTRLMAIIIPSPRGKLPGASAAAAEHARRLEQLRERRTLAELEQLPGERPGELAAARKEPQP